MARRFYLVCSGLAAVSLALAVSLTDGTALRAEAPPGPGDRAVVSGAGPEGLPVLADPANPLDPLATIPEGTEVTILQEPFLFQQIPWYLVTGYSEPEDRGWVDGSYLKTVEEEAPEGAEQDEEDRTASARGGAQAIDSFVATVTAYNLRGPTASGVYTQWGVVAVDPTVIPLGSKIQVEGFDETFIAADTGGGVRGRWVDIWFPSYAEARQFGMQARRITVLAP